VAENWETESAYQYAANVIKEGVIGRLHTFSLSAILYVDNVNNKWFDTPWRAKPQVGCMVAPTALPSTDFLCD